ncbi:hypothetical protein PQR63_08825 [Herbaspirillum rhizosphaerae]|jgi:hypothetical protein|uniref:Uncharacterized protein n=1 Tax=Herbaspirillum rhizosphaerae TaxID=346179 RepID=A0ABW8Z6L9_9BURK|nr:hypothetical protein [Herbaspirillum sp. meg3]
MDENQTKKSGPQTSADTAAIFERALDVGQTPANSNARAAQAGQVR